MEKGAPVVCHLTVVLDSYGGLGASANTPSCGHTALQPPSGLVHTANSSPLPVDCALNAEFQALPVPADTCLRPGRAGQQYSSLCRRLFCLPQMGVELASEPLNPPFCPR